MWCVLLGRLLTIVKELVPMTLVPLVVTEVILGLRILARLRLTFATI